MSTPPLEPRERADHTQRPGKGEGGFVAGGEMLLLGSLVFLVGIVLAINAVNVVDARMTADAVAREVARTLVEADPAPGLQADLAAVATATATAMGRAGPVDIEVRDATNRPIGDPADAIARCARVTVRATIEVDTLRVPFVGSWGSTWSMTGEHHEIVDPFRSGLAGEADCGG